MRTRETAAHSAAGTAVRNGWAGLSPGWGGTWRHRCPSVLLVLPQPLSFLPIFPPSLPLSFSLGLIFPLAVRHFP